MERHSHSITFFSTSFPSGSSDVRKGIRRIRGKGTKPDVTDSVIIPLCGRHSYPGYFRGLFSVPLEVLCGPCRAQVAAEGSSV